MDAGDLFVLLFWGAVILLSILQSAAKPRKQRDKERREEAAGLDEGGASLTWESAETMVPEDFWEEISGLARGGRRESTLGAPAEVRGEPPPEPPGVREEASMLREGERTRMGPGEATDEQPRRETPRWEAGPAVVPGPGRVRGGRASELLGDLSQPELQRAVLLHEILGPPSSKRRPGG